MTMGNEHHSIKVFPLITVPVGLQWFDACFDRVSSSVRVCCLRANS